MAAQLKKKLQEKLKKKNKDDAEERKKQDEKDAEELKDSAETPNTETPNADENESGETSGEDKVMHQAEDLVNGLADGNLDVSKFGDESENAKNAKDWYDENLQKETESINNETGLTDFEKNMKIGKAKKKLQLQAAEKFFFDSSYVVSEAKKEGKKAKVSQVVMDGLRNTGGKIKNSKVGKVTSRVYNKAKGAKTKLQDKGIIGKGGGKAIAEVMASSLTAIGEITGLSGLRKSLEDAKVLDSTYATVREFAQTLGWATDNLPKDDEAKAKEEQAKGSAEATNVAKVNVYSERVTRQMKEMQNLLDSMKK